MIHFITEKEFVPEVIYRCGTFKNEAERGLYQIVYGVLNHYMMYDDIYDLIVRICKEQKSEVVKRFKLIEWRDAVNSMITKLENLVKKYGDVMVYIPFTYYYDSLRGTLSRFEFVRFTLNEILAKGDGDMVSSSSPQDDYPLKALDLLIEDYRFDVVKNIKKGLCIIDEEEVFNELAKEKASYYCELIHDELIRRGVKMVTERHCHYDYVNDLHTEPYEITYEIFESKYYKYPEKFFELNGFNSKRKLLKVKLKDDVVYDKTNRDNAVDDTNTQEKTGIIYYMLKDLNKETVEKHWNSKAAVIINYVLSLIGNKYEPDTPSRYIRKIAKNDMGIKFYETVSDVLKKNGFIVPKEINEKLPKKQ